VIIGVNSAYHESAAAAVRDGVVLAAVEEERWSRRKHGKRALVSNPDELPWRSIRWALGAAGARPRDVRAVAYGFAPRARLWHVGRDAAPLADPAGWGSEAGERAFEAGLSRLPAALAEGGITAPLRFVPHHRAHAASAFYPSPYESAAVLVLDGIGEHGTAWLGRGRGARLTPIARLRYPDSLGLLWERACVHLGFSEYDAGKVMALAAYGDPARHRAAMGRLLRIAPDGGGDPGAPLLVVDPALARLRAADTDGLTALFGPPRAPGEPLDAPRLADVAAALQEATEEAVLAAARRLARLTGERRLAYAGGVALNCVANARLERLGPFESIYIPAAPHDAGTAVGAALEVALRLGAPREPGAPSPGPFLGPEAGEEEALEAARGAGLRVERVADAPARAAERIAEGALVGWCQGRLELGPRALGHRSVLADPRRAEVREALNRRVKHREPFRPFGASILAGSCAEWLDLPSRAASAPSRGLMLFAYPVRPERRARVPAVVHVDGTCRIQAVDEGQDPRFHALLRRFHEVAGVPLVLNTSFNDSEPIVLSPGDAVRTFLSSGLDDLFLGDLHARRPA